VPSLVPPVLAPGVLGGTPQPVLRAGHLVLRPWQSSDAPALVAAYADPAVQHWNGSSLDADEAAAYAGTWAEHWRTGRRVGWAVCATTSWLHG